MLLIREGWHGIRATQALLRDETEKRLCRTYIADSLGAMVGGMSGGKAMLYSEMITPKKPEPTAEQILDHVKGLFA